VAPRNEDADEVVARGASGSPQAAEDAIGKHNARTKSPARPIFSLRNPLRTPCLTPLPGGPANDTPKNGDVQPPPSVSRPHVPKSILKHSESVPQSENGTPSSESPEKSVRIISDPEIRLISPIKESPPNYPVSPPPPEDEHDKVAPTSSPETDNMAEGQRPKLKLSLKNAGSIQPAPGSTPSSAVRTPSTTLKLNFNKNKALPAHIIKTEPNHTPGSTTKKRKRTQKAIEADTTISSEDEGTPFKKPDPPMRRLTLKQPSKPALVQTPTSGVPAIKLKYKGKLPRRPIGVGYDSENEETEKDPVILEGFILRMQPGPDAEYVRKAIADGTVGMPRASGGADIQIRFFDTHGRRGVVVVRQQRYASSLVDLPCVVEGMKSWDRKSWIKSIDVCQMLLVLGKCTTDDEARMYPLPIDVDQKTWQYAHGLTVPMRWVRKRRFNRTKRARVDDIEAVERRVRALLEGDEHADSSSYTLHDHDPREDNEPGEESGEYESESGVEGSEEPDAPGTPVDYFGAQNGQGNRADSPLDDVDEDALLQTFEEEDPEDSRLPAPQSAHQILKPSLHPPEDASSFAVTSTSGSPSAAAPTPASAGDDDSGDEDEDDDEEESADEAEEEGDENRQQALDRIADMNKKIAEQTEVMRATDNAILKKKIAGKIAGLKGDVEQMRRAAGLESEEED
jgi:transcription initiation factor TFIID subunit 7